MVRVIKGKVDGCNVNSVKKMMDIPVSEIATLLKITTL